LRSIRAYLVVWLIGGLTVGIAAVLAAAYVLARAQIGEAFDDELKQVAHAVLLRDDRNAGTRVRIARPGFSLAVRAYDASGRVHFQTALPTLPVDLPLLYAEGFVHADTVEGPWRIYTHVTEEGVVQAGQPAATRDALARDLALRVVGPMLLLALAVTALAVWALTRGLAPLEETSRRVSDRDAWRLDPLPLDGAPKELLPLLRQINALLGRLAVSLDAERRFLADAAHELRSPVAALALQAQLAERAHAPQARAEAFAELGRGIERARRLVQQLLDFARLEAGMSSRARRRLDLGADAPGAVAALGSDMDLRSALDNLLDNALRYAPRGSAVTVSVRGGHGGARLAVVDAGPGIPPSERGVVFERFHRVAGDRTPGTGLGLAIVKTIVESHGGRVTLADAGGPPERPGLEVGLELPGD
jgi:two-component system OmpR family sensor kinase